MKEVLIILDGLMEKEFEKIDIGKFILGDIDRKYKLSFTDYSVKGKDIDSLNCIMNMLGYSPLSIDIGDRSFYEGLSQGITDYNYILRCNVVKIEENTLKDFTGGNLPIDIGSIIKNIHVVNGYIHPCYSYKNLLVTNCREDILKYKFFPPHFNLEKDIMDIMPESEYIKDIITNSYKYFNSIGMEGYALWPWGPSGKVNLERFNKKAGMVSGIDLLHGIGVALGMKSVKPTFTTGDCDTSLKNKLIESLKIIKDVDLLIVHINGLDELSHRKDIGGKIEFMNKVREEFIKPLIKETTCYNIRFKIACDHRSDSFTGSHEKGYVPIIGII